MYSFYLSDYWLDSSSKANEKILIIIYYAEDISDILVSHIYYRNKKISYRSNVNQLLQANIDQATKRNNENR